MPRQSFFNYLLLIALATTLLSPLVFYATGIGQSAAELAPELVRVSGGLDSSPKAVAHHRLTLPLRVERLLLYPILLVCFQLSGWSVAWRHWLEQRLVPCLRRGRLAGPLGWLVRRLSWERLRGTESVVILGFIAALDLSLQLIHLPLNFYAGFVVRHQFGLSRQNFLAWSQDYLIGLGIGLAITLISFGGLYLIMRLSPRRWPIWTGLAMVVFSFGLTLLEPVLITPLYYEIKPLEDAALRGRILTLAERAGLLVDDVNVIDASSKTTQANAYFTGFGRARKIVFWDTILDNYSLDEFEVVLAHEMGHWYYRHVLLSLSGGTALVWLGLFGLRWLLQRLWRPLGLRSPNDVAGLPAIMVVASLLALLSLPLSNGLSRVGESQADDFALAVSRQPEAFISLFERLAEQNLSMLDVPEWEKLLFYTHPPPIERLHKAQRLIRLR